jgi:hypothetical protein
MKRLPVILVLATALAAGMSTSVQGEAEPMPPPPKPSVEMAQPLPPLASDLQPVQPLAPIPVPKPTPPPTAAPAVSGDKHSLMAAAGIASGDYAAVDYIIDHESSWRSGAVNASSGATGLCQALPASKMASVGSDYLTNPVTQLRWCDSYAKGRYGSWSAALAFWRANSWW